MKRAALYARLSCKGQKDNTSPETQLDNARRFAEENGFEVVAEEVEIITGASRFGARIKFNAFLDMGERGLLDAIVTDVPDRLGRGRALSTLVDRAENKGLEILFADGTVLDDVELGVQIIKSGGERKEISRRTRAGRIKTAKNGGIVFSRAPYGYRIIRDYDKYTGKKIGAFVEQEPEEIQHVVDMFNWFVYKRESLRGIRRKLYNAHIWPVGAKKKMLKQYGELLPWDEVPEKSKEFPKKWSRSSIRRILSNPIYTGKWYYNRVETQIREIGNRMRQVIVGERDKSEWICLEVPGVISDEIFEQTQSIFRKNKQQQNGRPSKNSKNLLKGMLFCKCGRGMHGSSWGRSKGEGGDYRCSGDSETTILEEKCTYPRLNRDRVEGIVWEHIKEIMLHPEVLIRQYEEQQEEKEEKDTILLEQAEILRAEIHRESVKLDNLLNLFLAEDIDKQTYRRKKKQIEDAIRDTRLELAETEVQMEVQSFTQDHRAQLLEFCDTVANGFNTIIFEDKRKLLLILDVKVKYESEDNILVIQGVFPPVKVSIPSGRCGRQPPPPPAPV